MNEEGVCDTASFEMRLQKMGFTQSSSNVIAMWLNGQLFGGHKSTLGWAKIYRENVSKCDIFLSVYVKDFPNEERRLNV